MTLLHGAFYAVVGFVVLWGVWTGAARMAARSFRPLLSALGVLMAGAGACWLIGAGKTGGQHSGLLGTLMAMLLVLTAGSVAFGAGLRWVHDATRRRIVPESGPALLRPWDLWGLFALTGIAVIASLLE